jgi:hypothetical protein
MEGPGLRAARVSPPVGLLDAHADLAPGLSRLEGSRAVVPPTALIVAPAAPVSGSAATVLAVVVPHPAGGGAG